MKVSVEITTPMPTTAQVAKRLGIGLSRQKEIRQFVERAALRTAAKRRASKALTRKSSTGKKAA